MKKEELVAKGRDQREAEGSKYNDRDAEKRQLG